ncbi:T9SS type B sorting domain-containing protein [Pedobacter hiemivivus]|uniref:T9SS type B sorting domain-containing protein n=1 Tax=Pedobacter hiemivivus TaxID=2530454 RepID=A0A4V2MHV2_9SPHI|nr:gliding motility-associated C-terminal domain-containing protein [Pedobacter hiemivivus]TCC87866.1 T9SS type B sorting domain-containing protein [Pedobacter hiemivivus]
MKTSRLKGILMLLLVFATFKVVAEGSKQLAANGGSRAHWRSSTVSSTQFPFPSLGIIKVYAKVGETIYLGSSAQGIVGSTTGTMRWSAPNGVQGNSGTSTTVGLIKTRAQEVFGPSLTVGDGGYTPYTLVVGPGQEGVWEITFISTSLTAAGGNAPIVPVGDELAQNPNGFYIEAFDVSVKSTTNAIVPGRAFMNVFSGNTSNVANTYGSFNGIFNVLTRDGYKYTVNANGMQGAAFQFFVNNKGFRDLTGNAMYKSVVNVGTSAATIPVQNPTAADDATNVTHKLFFNAPASDLPSAAPSASGSVWLLNTIVTPTLSNLSFKGVEGTANLSGTNPLGGNFTFRTTVAGAYQIALDINKNGVFTDVIDRMLTGYATTINTDIVVNWDGLDGQGVKVLGNTIFPPGTVRVELLSGEVHFPLLDVEKNPGGIIVTRLNGNSPDDKLYWDDSDIPDSGTPSNPKRNLAGISSQTNGHKWTDNFGDNNGMDSWGYIPSTPLLNPVAFRLAEANLEVVSITSPASICQGAAASFVVTVRNNGPDNVSGTKFHIDLPAGLSGTTVVPAVSSGTATTVSSNLLAGSYDAVLNMNNAAVMTFTISGTVPAVPPAGFLAFKASILRPADVTDPDATNPDIAVPTDPDAECNSAPSGVGCNNIKNIQVTVNPALVTAPVSTVVQPTCAVATGSITVTAPLGAALTYSVDGITFQASTSFTSLTPGDYVLQVKNAGGCLSPIANVTINNQPVTPVAAAATAVQPGCAVTTGSIMVTAPLGAGLTYSINGISYQPSTTFSGLAAGNYQLTVKNAAGCVSAATPITINAAPILPATASATATAATCATPTGTITVTGPLGVGVSYSIDGLSYQAGLVFSGVAPGTYNLTVKNASGCVSAPLSIKVDFPEPAPVISQVDASCALPTGTITITPTGAVGEEYGLDGVYQPGAVFTGVAPGTHSITIRSVGGCVSEPYIAKIAFPIEDPVVEVIQTTCGTGTGSIKIINPLFGAGYTFSINGGGTYQAGNLFSGLSPATYQIVVKENGNNCLSGIITVVINPQPATPTAATFSVLNPNCTTATGSIIVNAPLGVGLSYSINGIDYQSSPTFAAVVPGVYNLTVKNNAGCVSTSVSITINPQPLKPVIARAITVQPTCALATGTITVTAPLGVGLTYAINGGADQVGVGFNGLIAGTYLLTVKNASGCISDPLSIVINPQPATPVIAVATAVQPTCAVATGSITVTAPLDPDFTYSVNGTTYQAGLNFTGLAAGTYQLTVKNSAGCVSSPAAVVINTPPAAPAIATVTTVEPTCAVATGSITVTAPLGIGLTYSVNGATYQSGVNFTGLAAATYQVTVKNAAGCVSAPLQVVIIPQPATPTVASVTIVQPTCAVATGSFTVTAPLGVGLTYAIDGSNYQSEVDFSALPAGTYPLTVMNGAGCVSTALSVVINPQPATPPIATATTVQPTCGVATGSITVTAPLGLGLTYSIDGTNYQAGVNFNNLAAGTTYPLTVKNAAGCVSTALSVVIIPQPATPGVPIVQNIAYCQGDPAIALVATGQQIKWYTGQTGGIPLPAAPIPATTVAGVTTWWASQTNASGCESARIGLTVTINAKPVLNITSSVADLTNEDAARVLTATPAGGTFTGTGVVLNGGTASFNPITAGIGTHTLTYSYTGPGNCTATLSFTIKVVEAPKVDLGVTIAAESRPIGAGEVFNYTIAASNKSVQNATEALVSVKLPAGLNFVSFQTAVGTANYNQSTGTLSWNIGALAAGKTETLILSVKAVGPGKYAVVAEISSKEQDVVPGNNISNTEQEITGLFIPDVITANGDGKNDQFKIRGIEMYAANELNILNRWGNSVYRSTGYKNDWTGEGLNDGTYFYSLRVQTTSGQWQIFKGYITLLRNR